MKFGLLKVFLKKFTPFLEEKFDDQHPDEKNDDYETDLNIPNSPSPHLAASNFNCIWKGDFKWEVLQNELDKFKRIKLIWWNKVSRLFYYTNDESWVHRIWRIKYDVLLKTLIIIKCISCKKSK